MKTEDAQNTACKYHALIAFAFPALKSPTWTLISSCPFIVYHVLELTAFLFPNTLSGVLVLSGVVPPSFFTSEWQLA